MLMMVENSWAITCEEKPGRVSYASSAAGLAGRDTQSDRASGYQYPTGRQKRPLGTVNRAVMETLSVPFLSRSFSGCGSGQVFQDFATGCNTRGLTNGLSSSSAMNFLKALLCQ